MRRQSKKLERLVEVHNKIIESQFETIASLDASLRDCDRQQAQTLASMEQMESMGLPKGPNYSRIFQEIHLRRGQLTKALLAAKAEHARVSAIVERLIERRSEIQSSIDQSDLEDSIDEWSNAQATFS